MKKYLLLFVALSFASATNLDAQVYYWDVEVTNISPVYANQATGSFAIPEGESEPGPLFPGSVYQFDVHGGPGGALHFATMMVQTNDLFFAPDSLGIPFYGEDGNPTVGDVTSYIQLWDAGTEVNEAPGEGVNQAPRQSGPNTGDDEGGVVQLVSDGFTYPAVADMIKVNLSPNGENVFTVRIQNISAGTIQTSGGDIGTPLAPGVWVSTGSTNPLFTEGEADRGEGLEALAEDGGISDLSAAIEATSGITQIFAPVAWASHSEANPLFTDGEAAGNSGLETLAEDGGPGGLVTYANMAATVTSGAGAVPVGADGPGPLAPGNSYKFTVSSQMGGHLSTAFMLVQSNDLFLAPSGEGIPLFDDAGAPVSGDVVSQLMIWDAGTEKNQIPGFGKDQAPRQSGPNTGSSENGVVRLVDDGYTYPDLSSVVSVTLTPLGRVPFTVRIENISTDATQPTSTGSVPVPIAPGVFTVAPVGGTLFYDGVADRGQGLEGVAEDGAAGGLGDAMAMKTGYDSGVFNTPVGASDPGPAFPGDAYEFTFEASPGARLNFATMMVQSNDLFFAPSEHGVALWNEDGFPISGDITDQVMLWDAGTEINEAPGEGPNQAPRQSGPNTGTGENGVVQLVNDGFTYAVVNEMITVTITPTATSVEEGTIDIPAGFSLEQNYPNPFNPETRIQFSVNETSPVNLEVYDVAGRLVRTLFTGDNFVGNQTVVWNGLDSNGVSVPSGVYLYRLDVADQSSFRTMVLMK